MLRRQLLEEVKAKKEANALEQNGKEPRRRRRRLRQRSGGQQRHGSQVNTTGNSVSQTRLVGNDASVQTNQASAAGRQNGGNFAVGPRGFPRGKAHVLFDEVTGDQISVQHEGDLSDNHRSVAPELAKYGPSSSDNHRSRTSQHASSNETTGRNEKINGNGAPKRKDKYEERWKRPYEIVATVLDKKAEESSSSTLDLAQVLDSYPTAPATPDSFEPKDVIAFKTLSLCLETWQPVVSEWKCGQVQSVDAPGASIKLSTWTLEANGNSVDFCETPNGEQLDVQTNEISEVRILSGPSYRPLGQTAPYPNPDEQEN